MTGTSQDPLLSRIRAFVRGELIPLEDRLRAGRFAELEPALRESRRRVKKLGLWAPFLPRGLGGLGLSLTEYAGQTRDPRFAGFGNAVRTLIRHAHGTGP